jgi:hypothetical protein
VDSKENSQTISVSRSYDLDTRDLATISGCLSTVTRLGETGSPSIKRFEPLSEPAVYCSSMIGEKEF